MSLKYPSEFELYSNIWHKIANTSNYDRHFQAIKLLISESNIFPLNYYNSWFHGLFSFKLSGAAWSGLEKSQVYIDDNKKCFIMSRVIKMKLVLMINLPLLEKEAHKSKNRNWTMTDFFIIVRMITNQNRQWIYRKKHFQVSWE